MKKKKKIIKKKKEQRRTMHPLALTPTKSHKIFFAEISSMKIRIFKSPSHHFPVQSHQ